MDPLAERYTEIRNRIDRACARAGRPPEDVTLVAVSKTFPVERVQALHDLGHVDFGENKAQELAVKASALPGIHSGGHATWHAIGHLQRNKAREIVQFADVFHALDSVRLAAELDRRCVAAGRRLACFVQVNISGEDSKSGIDPGQVHAFIDALRPYRSLDITGLMALASPAADPESVRPEFRRLADLARAYPGVHEGVRPECLSMGMSADFEVAIEEGATHVRIGSAIFGER
jgi:PLP dependent protein